MLDLNELYGKKDNTLALRLHLRCQFAILELEIGKSTCRMRSKKYSRFISACHAAIPKKLVTEKTTSRKVAD